MPTRSRKETLTYRKVQAGGALNKNCVFCGMDPSSKDRILTTKSFFVIKNIYQYTSWDNQQVEDHLMIVPKKHTDTLSDLTRDEAVEYVDLMGSYESRGYSVWARAPQSSIKSVVHQHTHLIKAGQKTHRFLFYLRRPYVRFLR